MRQPVLHPPLRFLWLWIMLLVAIGFCVKPAFRTMKSWRGIFFLKSAGQALIEKNLDRAEEQALLCLQLRPDEIEAYRVLARVSDLRKDSRNLSFWMYVAQSDQVNDADRIALAEVALQEGMVTMAEQQLSILMSRPVPHREVYHLAGLLAARQQRPSVAREWFQKALALDPGYARAEMNLARVEIFFPESKEAEERGLERLRKLGTRPDEWGLGSLRILAAAGKSNPKRLPYDPNIADQLKKHPLAQMEEKSIAVDWEIRTHPERRDDLVAAMTSSVADLSSPAKRELAAWLNRLQLFQKTLAVFPLDQAATEPLLLVQLDAMAALGRWEELDRFLSNHTLHLQPVLRSLYRARVAGELGNQRLFDLGWRQAVRETENHANAIRYLADYSEKLGEIGRSTEAYEILSQNARYRLEALLKLVRLYEKMGQTRLLFQTMQRLSVLCPQDPVISSDLAYLGLLLNDPSLQSHELARAVYAVNPHLSAFAATYALAQLKAGLPAVALETMEYFSPDQITAPGWQAVHATALAANGHKAEAIAMAQKIDFKNLKPEEKELMAEFWKPKQ